MFCRNCGKEIKDGVAFCGGCGSKCSPESSSQSGSATNDVMPNHTKKQKNKIIGMIAVAIMAIIIAVPLVTFFGGRSAERTAEQLISATYSMDVDKLVDLFYYDAFKHMMEEDGYEEDEFEELFEEVEDELEDILDMSARSLGVDIDEVLKFVTIKVEDKEEIDGYKYEELKEEYEDIDIEIRDACMLTIVTEIEYEDIAFERDMYVQMVKIGSSWYLDVFNEATGMF